jgi:hypothetical protein
MPPATRACERNSALFATVLSRVGRRVLRGLDVDSLARTAAACAAGRDAVAALGNAPWRKAIVAIQRDLTHGELPPARPGVYTTREARTAGEAAHAGYLAQYSQGFMCMADNAYREAHYAAMHAAAQARARGF